MNASVGNFHTHCYLCDGEGLPVDYARAALDLGFSGLGFTSHAPLPFPVSWVMERANLARYTEIVEEAASEAPELPVFKGLEIDYLKGRSGPDPALFPEIELDFVIGSVHFVSDEAGELIAIDGPVDKFEYAIERFAGEPIEMVAAYYSLLREMLSTYHPDILGHLDLILKNNRGDRYFDPESDWYRSEVTSTLDAIAANGCIVEVNTGALARGYEVLYPQPWIVEKLCEREIPMMVNSDAHSPDKLDFAFDRAFELLSTSGYKVHWMLTTDGWQAFPIE